MEILTRQEAKTKNLKWYFTGFSCRNGHIDKRLVSNGTCYSCIKKVTKVKYLENRDSFLEYKKKYYSNRKEHFSKLNKDWKINNKERYKQINRNYRLKNLEKLKNYRKEYKKNNRPYFNFLNSLRRKAVIKATPYWSDLEKIKDLYLNCPKGYSVDHVIPLTSDLVCGLHVPENLQYLTKSENSSKNNKFESYIEVKV